MGEKARSAGPRTDVGGERANVGGFERGGGMTEAERRRSEENYREGYQAGINAAKTTLHYAASPRFHPDRIEWLHTAGIIHLQRDPPTN